MSEFVLTPVERALLAAFDAAGVRYLIVGMGAALLEGVLPLGRVIASKRASNRPKDLAQLPILEATLAARAADDDRA